jgi:hypothetical protein
MNPFVFAVFGLVEVPHSQSRPDEPMGSIAPLERLRGRSCGAQNEASGWKPRRERVAQKRTQVVETIGARKLVRGAETGKRS